MKFPTSAATAIAVACAALPAFAADAPDGQWRGAAGASVAITSGNSSSQAALASLDLVRATEGDKWTLGASVNYGRSKVAGVTSTTSNKEGGFGQYDHDLAPGVFAFGKLGLEHDSITDMTLRTLLGAGVGVHIVQTKSDTFDVFGGGSYVDTTYSSAQTIGSETATRFHSVGLLLGEESSNQLTENTTLKQRLEYDPGLSGVKNQLFKFNGSLAVNMSKSLALNVGVTDTFNSKVAAGQKKNDLSVFTGISIKFGG
jgi:putative salt-induced outer membrane protein